MLIGDFVLHFRSSPHVKYEHLADVPRSTPLGLPGSFLQARKRRFYCFLGHEFAREEISFQTSTT